MTKFKITEGSFRLKNGALTLSFPDDILPNTDKTSPSEPVQEKPEPKTAAERQKELYERRKADGWKKIYVDPATIELAQELGGIENIVEDRQHWIRTASELNAKIESSKKPWWKVW